MPGINSKQSVNGKHYYYCYFLVHLFAFQSGISLLRFVSHFWYFKV